MSTAADLQTDPGTARFSDVIRTATFSDHETAAMSESMTALFNRELAIEAYTSLVAQHYFAYVPLEAAGDALVDHPVAGAFVTEALRRVPSLEADLQVLVGDDWRDKIEASPATQAYVDRLVEVCIDHPEKFVAHHYTRYMGDLSGGQMIGRIARSAYELEPGAGAAFYEFPDLGDLAEFKEQYRVALDNAEWTDEERASLLDEVVVAYRLNTEVFTDLDNEFMGAANR